MNFITKVIDWLWMSSADPTKVGLSAKSTLTMIAAGLTMALGFANIHVGNAEISLIIDSIVAVIQYALLAVGAIGAVIGAVRKVILTLKGDNQVLNTPQ